MKRFVKVCAQAVCIFSFLGWIYIMGNAWFHPETLPLPLTHFSMWPREDTFGIVCIFTSFVSFIAWKAL